MRIDSESRKDEPTATWKFFFVNYPSRLLGEFDKYFRRDRSRYLKLGREDTGHQSSRESLEAGGRKRGGGGPRLCFNTCTSLSRRSQIPPRRHFSLAPWTKRVVGEPLLVECGDAPRGTGHNGQGHRKREPVHQSWNQLHRITLPFDDD